MALRVRPSLCDFRPADLRFWDSKLEAAFMDDLQPQVLKSIIGTSLVIILLCISGLSTDFQNLSASDMASSGGQGLLQDPRYLYYGAHLFQIAVASFTGALSLLRINFAWLRSLDWELVVTAHSIVLLVGSYSLSEWYVAALYGAPHVIKLSCSCSEQAIILSSSLGLWGLTVVSSVRCCRLWLTPATAVITYVVFRSAAGAPDPFAVQLLLPELLCLCFFSMYGARRHERHVREKWLGQRQLRAQAAVLEDNAAIKRAMEMLAGTLSDIVVELNADLMVKNTGSVVHDSFFMTSVGGLCFPEELASPADKDRLLELFGRARLSGVLESCPMQLKRGKGQDFEVQVMVVAVASEMPMYLVGIREDSEHQRCVTFAQEELFTPAREELLRVTQMSDLIFAPARDELGRVTQMSDLTSQSCLSVTNSTAFTGRTGRTERIFADLARINSPLGLEDETVQRRLEQVCRLGCAEHWLLDWEELEFPQTRQQIGCGSFGDVLLAELHGTQVAVKAPRHVANASSSSSRALSVKALPSFTNELRMLRRLRHPKIVLFHGALIDPEDGYLALVSEVVDGPTLEHAVRRESPALLSDAARWRVLLDVSKALRFMHAQEPAVLHGDLKGSNVMLEQHRGMQAKLLDFGLSRLQTSAMRPMGGSFNWRAPELFRSHGQGATPAADVFSFGRLAFLTFTGLSPFCGAPPDLPLDSFAATECEALWALSWPADHQVPGIRQLSEDCNNVDPLKRPSMAQVQKEIKRQLDILLHQSQPCGESVALAVSKDTGDGNAPNGRSCCQSLSL
ncbi:unnamed protein product [Polarella glacialis]|uniref:Protein kinase domain-containing protein n=1 Tax=Polarella glacialis TaxID=89957 RepID=A0A813JM72_POLGL|nr:unnamed protein product [Polarella glacialis]